MRARVAAAAPVLALCCLLPWLGVAAAGGPVRAEAEGSPTPVATFGDERITESSGLAVSRRHPGVLWTINDSGDEPRLYAVGADGTVRAVLTLGGVVASDFEALAGGPADSLWVADIGDNDAERSTVAVHSITEPETLRSAVVVPQSYELRYPDGAHDAEALLVHPRTGRLSIVTKSVLGAAFYLAPPQLSVEQVNRLVRGPEAPAVVTDGAWSPDGSRLALRGYGSARVLSAPGQPARTVDLPRQPQGESLAWSLDGRALLVGSEGEGSTVYRVPVGTGAQPVEAASPQPRPPGLREDTGVGVRRVGRVALLVVVVLVIGGVAAASRLLRR